MRKTTSNTSTSELKKQIRGKKVVIVAATRCEIQKHTTIEYEVETTTIKIEIMRVIMDFLKNGYSVQVIKGTSLAYPFYLDSAKPEACCTQCGGIMIPYAEDEVKDVP